MASTITYPRNPADPNGPTITRAIPGGLSKKQFNELPEPAKRAMLYPKLVEQEETRQVNTTGEASTEGAASPVLQAVLDGLLFGFGDELISAAQSAVGDVSYEEALAANRAAARQYADENPGASFGLEMAGSLPYIFIPGVGFAKAATLGQRMLQTAVRSVPGGFLAGYGEGEGDLVDRAMSGAVGGGMSAVLGGATPALTDLASNVYRRIFGGESVADANAVRRVREVMAKDNVTTQDIRNRMANRQTMDGSGNRGEMLVDDMGRVSSNLLERTATRPSPAMDIAETALRERKEGRYGRIQKDVTDTLGEQPNYFKEIETIDAKRYSQARPLYNAVANIGRVDDPKINFMLNRYKELFDKAWPEARDIILFDENAPADLVAFARRNTGSLVNEAGEVQGPSIVDAPVTASLLDYLQRGLSEIVNPTSKLKIGGKEINAGKVKKQFVERLEEILVDEGGNPVFKQARRIYADAMETKRAIDKGRKDFMNMDPEEITKYLGNKSAAAKDAFMAGAVRNITDKIARKSDTNPANAQPFTSDFYRSKLKALISAMSDDPLTADNTFAELMRKISREKRMGDNEQKVIGGSPTARRLGELTPDASQSAAGMELATQAATGGTLPGGGILLSKLANVLGGAFRERSDTEVARMLTAMTPDQKLAVLKRLESNAPEIAGEFAARFMQGPGAMAVGRAQTQDNALRMTMGGLR